jgi:hypothetical protein
VTVRWMRAFDTQFRRALTPLPMYIWCRPFRMHGRHGVQVVPSHSISEGCRDVWDTSFVTELTKKDWDSGKRLLRLLRHANADTMDSYVMCLHTYLWWF